MVKLPKYWRYRVWTYYADFSHWCGWITLPSKVLRARLWDWAHYENGGGSHLKLAHRPWREIWRVEYNRYKYGEF